MNIDTLDFDKLGGLIPAIIQDASTGEVLMLGFMNREALARTLSEGCVTFWSRTRKSLWRKGETSGNTLSVVSIDADCDHDSLLVKAIPNGPTCHTGATSCFAVGSEGGAYRAERKVGGGTLEILEQILLDRHEQMPDGSYTAELFRSGRARIAQKVGEEGVEVVIAAMQDEARHLPEEAADLLYHLTVLLIDCGYRIEDVGKVLRARSGG